MKFKSFVAVMGFVLAFTSIVQATVFQVTFDNVLIANNPNYPVTGSFLYDDSELDNPLALYGLSNFNLTAVTPYGIFQMITAWSVDSTFDYLGLGISNSSSTPALVLVFSLQSNGNGAGLNDLNQAAVNHVPLPILPLGSGSDFIPGGSALVSSVDDLYSAYDQYIYHGGPSPESLFLSVSGSLDPSPISAVPEPSTCILFLTGLGALGLVGRKRFSNRRSIYDRLLLSAIA
jgi:PEP-CTERM motif